MEGAVKMLGGACQLGIVSTNGDGIPFVYRLVVIDVGKSGTIIEDAFFNRLNAGRYGDFLKARASSEEISRQVLYVIRKSDRSKALASVEKLHAGYERVYGVAFICTISKVRLYIRIH